MKNNSKYIQIIPTIIITVLTGGFFPKHSSAKNSASAAKNMTQLFTDNNLGLTFTYPKGRFEIAEDTTKDEVGWNLTGCNFVRVFSLKDIQATPIYFEAEGNPEQPSIDVTIFKANCTTKKLAPTSHQIEVSNKLPKPFSDRQALKDILVDQMRANADPISRNTCGVLEWREPPPFAIVLHKCDEDSPSQTWSKYLIPFPSKDLILELVYPDSSISNETVKKIVDTIKFN